MSGLRIPGLVSAALLSAIPVLTEQPVVTYKPAHEELKYTFSGAAPVRRIKPGTRIVSWTEDCYDGAVTKPGQLPSKVQLPGHDNPQTGPFFIEGAEPGDTIAVRIEKLEPARDYGISLVSRLRSVEQHRPHSAAARGPPGRSGSIKWIGPRRRPHAVAGREVSWSRSPVSRVPRRRAANGDPLHPVPDN